MVGGRPTIGMIPRAFLILGPASGSTLAFSAPLPPVYRVANHRPSLRHIR